MLFKQKRPNLLFIGSAIALFALINGCSDEQRSTKYSTAINANQSSQTKNTTKPSPVVKINTPPIANAGNDLIVRVGEVVTLNGKQSTDADQDSLTYHWQQESGPRVSIVNSNTATPSFIAPATKQPLSFSLAVNDGQVDSDIATVIINVSNRAPLANAGRTIISTRASKVMLDGSSSVDPDKDSLNYEWSQTYGEKVELSDSSKISPTFTMPNSSGYLIFALTVTDGTDKSIIDTVAVKVDNTAPIAKIVPITHHVYVGETVRLDGRQSTDADGDALAYGWSQVLGAPVLLEGANTATPQFKAPERPDYLIFELVVNDGELSSFPESMIVSVKNKPKPITPAVDLKKLASLTDMSLSAAKKSTATLPVVPAPAPVENFLPEMTKGFVPAPILDHHGKPSHGNSPHGSMGKQGVTGMGHHKVHWGYEGEGAPSHWAKLDSNFAVCGSGKQQSPIDIKTVGLSISSKPIVFHYGTSAINVVNNGHTIQVNYDQGSYALIDGKRYDLLQFHFHSPSEHTIDGKPADMVAHLVHKAEDGSLAVVAVLFKEGSENTFLKSIWSNLPLEPGMHTESPATIFAENIMPETKSYYHYSGSLTTPPCSEGVNWNVMTNMVEASAAQIDAFNSIFAKSVRPTQALHGREIMIK